MRNASSAQTRYSFLSSFDARPDALASGRAGVRGLPALFVIICSPVSVALYVIYFYILARTVLTAVRIERPVCGRSIRLVND